MMGNLVSKSENVNYDKQSTSKSEAVGFNLRCSPKKQFKRNLKWILVHLISLSKILKLVISSLILVAIILPKTKKEGQLEHLIDMVMLTYGLCIFCCKSLDADEPKTYHEQSLVRKRTSG